MWIRTQQQDKAGFYIVMFQIVSNVDVILCIKTGSRQSHFSISPTSTEDSWTALKLWGSEAGRGKTTGQSVCRPSHITLTTLHDASFLCFILFLRLWSGFLGGLPTFPVMLGWYTSVDVKVNHLANWLKEFQAFQTSTVCYIFNFVSTAFHWNDGTAVILYVTDPVSTGDLKSRCLGSVVE